MDLLLEHGAEVDSKGGKYGDALQAAALKAGQHFVLRLLELQANINDVSGKYGTALQAASSAGDALTVALLLQHGANPLLEGGLYGNALNAAARRANIDVLNHLLEQEFPYDMLNRAMIQAVLFRQDEAVIALLKKGASVDAMDELGSPLELLQKPQGEDTNSDFGGDEEEDDDDSDVSDEEDEEDDDEEDEDEALKSESEDDESSVSDNTDNGASVADLQLESPSTAESKIQKYLEDAKARMRRNPSLRVSTAIQRKPIVRADQAPASTAQYDVYGVSKPQKSESIESTNPTSSNEWRKNPYKPDTYPYKTSTYGQAAPITAASNEYAAYSSRPPFTQAFDSHNQQPRTGTASSDSYMANRPSQSQASHYPDKSQHDSPAQPRPPIPPKVPSYSDLSSLPSILRPSHSSQNLNTASNLPPPPPPHPPTPPRPQAANSNYRAYAQNTQQSSPYHAYQTPQPSQTPPPLPLGQAPYAAYTPPPQQSQHSGQPPRKPLRPSAAQSQSDDLLEIYRLEQKAQKFAGRCLK